MNLLLFNLKTDDDDDVLGFTTDWINVLSTHFEEVYVITMHLGALRVAPNVTVYSVGKEKGNSRPRRLLEFYRHLSRILRSHRIDACFAHMMPLFAVLGWPLLAMRRIPILLWFAHKSTPLTLRLAHRLVDKVVTSNSAGFSLASRKVLVIGHGISEDKFKIKPESENPDSSVIIAVGRISPIKHLKELIEAFAYSIHRLGMSKGRLVLLGDALTETDRRYKAELEGIVEKRGISHRVEFAGAVPHREVSAWLTRAILSVNLSGTGAYDKSVLESLAAGVPLLVMNRNFSDIFHVAGVDPEPFMTGSLNPEMLGGQLIRFLDPKSVTRETREILARSVLEHHGLKTLARRLAEEIAGLVRLKRERAA